MAVNKPQQTEEEIRAGIPNLDDFDAFHNKILVGIYMGPEKTKGGVLLPDKVRDEDRWQCRCGVVLKVGKAAFVSDSQNIFVDSVAEGDWLVFRSSNGSSLDIEGVHCRLLQEADIEGRVKDPTMVY